MTLHAAATEGEKTKIVCPGCDEGRGCSHCGYRGWVWHYLTECPICHSAVSVVNGEAELCECQKQGDVEREEGVPEHLAALRRDLERPGRVGLYLAGISAALTAIVREHPELVPSSPARPSDGTTP